MTRRPSVAVRAAFALALGAAALTPFSMASATPVPTVTKAGAAHATNSPTEIQGGDQADWTIDVSNAGDKPFTAELVDGIGANQTLVPGSVKAPDGWLVTYSNTGTAGPFTDPASAAAKAFKVNSGLLPANALGGAVGLTSPGFHQVTGGDGFIPQHTANRIYNLFHHTGPGNVELNCIEKATASTCAGYPKELFVNSPNDLYTPYAPRIFTDESTGKVWFSATHATDGGTDEGGVFCFDAVTGSPCASGKWYPLVTGVLHGTANNSARSPVGGIAVKGTKVFAASISSSTGVAPITVSCFDTATLTACGNANLNPGTLPGWDNAAHGDNRSPVLHMQVVGDHFYFIVDYATDFSFTQRTYGNRLFCYDMAAQAGCAGWTTPMVPDTDNAVRAYSGSNDIVPNQDAPGTACVINSFVTASLIPPPGVQNQLESRKVICFTATGAAAATPAGLQAAVDSVPTAANATAGSVAVNSTYVSETIGSKMWVPFAAVTATGTMVGSDSWVMCYDFSTHAKCAGFGSGGVTDFPEVNGGQLYLYGIQKDAAGCLWGLGDRGWEYSFLPVTGETPCPYADGTLRVNPQSFYCRSEQADISWNKATLHDIDPGDLVGWKLSVNDAANNPVPGFQNIAGTGDTVSLAGLPPGSPYTFKAVVQTTDPSSWNGGSPSLVVSFDGPPAQVCAQTQTPKCEAQGNVPNQVDAKLTDADGTVAATGSNELTLLGASGSCTTTTTTSTTVKDTTTTTSTTTSTTTTSSTVPVTVQGTTTVKPPVASTTVPMTTVPVTVQGTTTVPSSYKPPGTPLAYTGGQKATLALQGALLLLGGVVLLLARRRRTA